MVGIDVAKDKCDVINRGDSYIQDVPPSEVASLVDAGRLSAESQIGAMEGLDTINICVPTPLRKTKDPDLSYVVWATQTVKAHSRPAC